MHVFLSLLMLIHQLLLCFNKVQNFGHEVLVCTAHTEACKRFVRLSLS